MIHRETGLLGNPEVAQETRAYFRALNVPDTHPILTARTFERRVAKIIASGAVPFRLINNRRYCEKSVAPLIAMHLGLVVAPAASDREIAA